jgi:hypothetical protein
MAWPQNLESVAAKRREERLGSAGRDLERKYWVALLLYLALAVLVWFTMDAGQVFVWGKPVELRLVPLIVIGGMALRTVLARHADRIRRARSGDEGGSSAPRG